MWSIPFVVVSAFTISGMEWRSIMVRSCQHQTNARSDQTHRRVHAKRALCQEQA